MHGNHMTQFENMLENILWESFYVDRGEVRGHNIASDAIIKNFAALAAAAAPELVWKLDVDVFYAYQLGLTYCVVADGWIVYDGRGFKKSSGVEKGIIANKKAAEVHYRNRIAQIFGGTYEPDTADN